ncbi:MAG TPA: hypothetical protein VFA18_20145 [Gemmataceae bacterium]|nr:hypothetical protein [Gemmataceae bacterium]
MSRIELSEQQRLILEREQGKPVDVIDPATQRRYVLLTRELYERNRQLLEPPTWEPAAAPAIPSAVLRAQQAFWRDLPQRLKRKAHNAWWVAYHGDRPVGFGKRGSELYERCMREGLKPDEFYIAYIDERDTPPWGSEPIERSLHEFSDEPPLQVSPPSP